MRYIMVLFWSVLISSVVSYVLSSMSGDAFNVQLTLIFAAILSITIIILGDGILKNTEEH